MNIVITDDAEKELCATIISGVDNTGDTRPVSQFSKLPRCMICQSSQPFVDYSPCSRMGLFTRLLKYLLGRLICIIDFRRFGNHDICGGTPPDCENSGFLR